jgi:hypothetical protein
MLVLPFHRDTMKMGILVAALKKAGISQEEFLELL